ncbi:CidA/LrgA family protein [Xanthomonas massiliensis]|jgi:holin-like protein|uniref:CidA/LrgA family protein n=1 Tax=Xanthomonas massiliensis TaxID=1720302 RepID=UPI00098FB9C1|nr:CidA/LrgA family protein [Xanthomonas massiliensis]
MNIPDRSFLRPVMPLARRHLRGSRVAQIALIVLVWGGAEWAVRRFDLPIPSGILGMVLLLVLLLRHWLSPHTLTRGANWLLAEMLLFFVPAAMILLDNRQMLGWLGIKLLAVVLGGTVLVMASTALTVDLLYRWSRRREQ